MIIERQHELEVTVMLLSLVGKYLFQDISRRIKTEKNAKERNLYNSMILFCAQRLFQTFC